MGKTTTPWPPFFQNGAKFGFEMCFGPSTLGAGAKTRLESRIKTFTPHCVCRYEIYFATEADPATYYFGASYRAATADSNASTLKFVGAFANTTALSAWMMTLQEN